MCDKPHRPTHRHHEYVPEPQVHHPPDDARQRPQDAKDLHGLYQAILRGDRRRNRRHVQEREWDVVIVASIPKDGHMAAFLEWKHIEQF